MADSVTTYTKLPGTSSGFALRSRLFLGDDHLLYLESTGYTERYRRYYYRDIMAISVRRTRDFEVLTAVFAVLPLLLAIPAIAFSSADSRPLFIVLMFVCLIPLVVNVAMGPTCVCEVHTAASRDKLPSLGRIRRARKALAMLRPRIEAAQGAEGSDQLAANLAAYDARILQERVS
jgi:hypothetical protein